MPSDKSFGLTFATVFLLAGMALIFYSNPYGFWALVASGIFAATAMIRPTLLSPLNRIWFAFGQLLHKIVNPIIMGAIFFSVITPMGLTMRVFGKDFLRLKPGTNAATYWIDRNPPGPDAGSFKNQF